MKQVSFKFSDWRQYLPAIGLHEAKKEAGLHEATCHKHVTKKDMAWQ